MAVDRVNDVIVVGAGLSGLYAAKLLQQSGLTVAVLEARDRVGGRMLSQRLADGTVVDLGAQWIGPGQRRMHALAKEYGLKTHATHTQGDGIIKLGQPLRRMSRKIPPISWIALLDIFQASWRIDRDAKKISATKPWEHPQAEQLDSLSFEEWLQKNMFSNKARAYWRYLTEAGMCTSSNDFSPLEVLQQIGTMGGLEALETADSTFFEDGTQTIAQRIADELGDCVHLSAPVQAILTKESKVLVVTDKGDFLGKRVILALPPQLVEKITFDETLSSQFNERPNHPVLGKVIKNIVVYDRAWWRDLGLSGRTDTPDELIEFTADTSKDAGQPGILVTLASGAHAVELSQMDSEIRKATVLAHVQKLFGKAPTPPQDFFSMDWINEAYSHGGYASRRPIGGWIAQQNTLAQSVGPIHFAGTETATEWRSYMEGALQSAERASVEVISAIGQPSVQIRFSATSKMRLTCA